MSEGELQPYQPQPAPQGRGSLQTTGWVVAAIVVTLTAVFFVLNYQKQVSVDFLLFDLRTRLIWVMLIPLSIGLLIGLAAGRMLRR
jgi:uncharacterized integral membrane protein